MQKSLRTMPKHYMQRPSSYYPPNVKRSDFTVVTSGAEDLNLRSRAFAFATGFLPFPFQSKESRGNSDRKIKSFAEPLTSTTVTHSFFNNQGINFVSFARSAIFFVCLLSGFLSTNPNKKQIPINTNSITTSRVTVEGNIPPTVSRNRLTA